MSDKSSGRNDLNSSGSDSKPHYGSTPSAEYAKAGAIKPGTPTRRVGESIVGNGKPGPADPRSIVKT
jgi:hypothetical protein